MQPLKPGLLNPDRRSLLLSGEEVDRGAYAQTDPSSFGMFSDAGSKDLLLWHPDRQKRQRSLRLDNEVNAPLDLRLRCDEAHRRRDELNVDAGISLFQSREGSGRRTDEGYLETLLSCLRNKLCGQVAPGDDRQMQAFKPRQSAQHAAVTKHTPRSLVEWPQGPTVIEQSDHVMHVRRHDVFEASRSLTQDFAQRPFEWSGIKTEPKVIGAFRDRYVASSSSRIARRSSDWPYILHTIQSLSVLC